MAITEAQADITKIIALGGSLKMEVRNFTGVLNDDTFTSKLATPLFAMCFSTTDAGGVTQNDSVTVSGKTLTFRDPPTQNMCAIVFGT